jgi:hypothetical protein
VTTPYPPGPQDAPDPQRPWPAQATPPLTVATGKRKVRPLNVVLLSALALVVLCCGGVAIVNALVSPSKPDVNSAAQSTPDARQLAGDPSTTHDPTGALTAPAEPSPTAAPSTTSASPRSAATRKPVVKPTTKKPVPKPTKAKPPVGKGVYPGAFCSPRGAFGTTNAGTLMQCKPSATDTRNRWRKA